jgi:SAM-dependent methyltransferase
VPDFSRRAHTPELMDSDTVDFETFRGCLKDLSKVNRLTLAYRPTLAFLERLRSEGLWPQDRPMAILDVGSGYGDMLREIKRWAAKRGLDVRLAGLDRNPWSRASAEGVAGSEGIVWATEDLFDYRGGADVVLSSLFTHHLDDASLVRFIEWQEQTARIGWFINDLKRHPFAYFGFGVLATVMRWHPFVRHDGPVSISRAFLRKDWRATLSLAGAAKATIEDWFPFRLCVARVRG